MTSAVETLQTKILQVSSLHYAARQNSLDILSLLLSRGAEVNITSAAGLTPLHFAARFKISSRSGEGGGGEEEVDPGIAMLVEHGAEINKKDKFGLTALHYACMRGNITATDQLARYPHTDLELGDDQAGLESLKKNFSRYLFIFVPFKAQLSL